MNRPDIATHPELAKLRRFHMTVPHHWSSLSIQCSATAVDGHSVFAEV